MKAPTLKLATTKTFLAISLAASLLMGGCATVTMDTDNPDAPIPSLANPSLCGSQQAHRDLRAGQIRVMEAGQVGLDPEEIAPNDGRLRNIPRVRLPWGVGVKNAVAWAKYA